LRYGQCGVVVGVTPLTGGNGGGTDSDDGDCRAAYRRHGGVAAGVADRQTARSCSIRVEGSIAIGLGRQGAEADCLPCLGDNQGTAGTSLVVGVVHGAGNIVAACGGRGSRRTVVGKGDGAVGRSCCCRCHLGAAVIGCSEATEGHGACRLVDGQCLRYRWGVVPAFVADLIGGDNGCAGADNVYLIGFGSGYGGNGRIAAGVGDGQTAAGRGGECKGSITVRLHRQRSKGNGLISSGNLFRCRGSSLIVGINNRGYDGIIADVERWVSGTVIGDGYCQTGR